MPTSGTAQGYKTGWTGKQGRIYSFSIPVVHHPSCSRTMNGPMDYPCHPVTDQNATHDAMNRMELFGAMPPADEVDPRPLPDQNASFAALEGVFDTLAELFIDTCLESEATDVLWNTVNVFQRKLDRLDKGFNQLSFDIRSAIREQDGTEVKSVELEKLEIRAKATSYARDYFETLRGPAGGHYGYWPNARTRLPYQSSCPPSWLRASAATMRNKPHAHPKAPRRCESSVAFMTLSRR